eukprot:3278364-Alexandrium_andersonii.AAC.1
MQDAFDRAMTMGGASTALRSTKPAPLKAPTSGTHRTSKRWANSSTTPKVVGRPACRASAKGRAVHRWPPFGRGVFTK